MTSLSHAYDVLITDDVTFALTNDKEHLYNNVANYGISFSLHVGDESCVIRYDDGDIKGT